MSLLFASKQGGCACGPACVFIDLHAPSLGKGGNWGLAGEGNKQCPGSRPGGVRLSECGWDALGLTVHQACPRHCHDLKEERTAPFREPVGNIRSSCPRPAPPTLGEWAPHGEARRRLSPALSWETGPSELPILTSDENKTSCYTSSLGS